MYVAIYNISLGSKSIFFICYCWYYPVCGVCIDIAYYFLAVSSMHFCNISSSLKVLEQPRALEKCLLLPSVEAVLSFFLNNYSRIILLYPIVSGVRSICGVHFFLLLKYISFRRHVHYTVCFTHSYTFSDIKTQILIRHMYIYVDLCHCRHCTLQSLAKIWHTITHKVNEKLKISAKINMKFVT